MGIDLIKSAKAATTKALEEYLHELRVAMIHIMAVCNYVILCPIDFYSMWLLANHVVISLLI